MKQSKIIWCKDDTVEGAEGSEASLSTPPQLMKKTREPLSPKAEAGKASHTGTSGLRDWLQVSTYRIINP